MVRLSRLLAGSALLVTGSFTAAPALAHHSFAQFDVTKTQQLHGTLYRVEWTNPHMWIWITADNGDKWGFEAGAPAQLVRDGFPRSSLQEGTKLTITFHPVRDGRHGGSLTKVAFDDGRVISNGGAIASPQGGPPGGGAGAPPPQK